MNWVSLRTAVPNVSGSIARLHLLGPATIGSVGPDWSGGGGVGQPGLDPLEGGDCCKPSSIYSIMNIIVTLTRPCSAEGSAQSSVQHMFDS